jgi:6-phosphofructokinase 1
MTDVERIAVLTSGGDAPGMNAVVRSVVRHAAFMGIATVGVRRGFQGLIRGEFVSLQRRDVADIIHRGGTVLYTARSEAFLTPEGQAMAVAHLRAEHVDGLVVVGGDGSLRGAMALERLGLPTVGVPATIDNDVVGTEPAIGFDTAANTALEAIDRVRDTATAHERVFVVEVMGRRSGFLALEAGLAGGAECVLVPEIPYDMDEVATRVRQAYTIGKRHSILVVAEGAAHGFDVGQELERRTGLETRVTVLGHTQRGGTPSAVDRVLGSRLGAAAVEALATGRRGIMVGSVSQMTVETPYDRVLERPRPLDPVAYALIGKLAI